MDYEADNYVSTLSSYYIIPYIFFVISTLIIIIILNIAKYQNLEKSFLLRKPSGQQNWKCAPFSVLY